MDDLTRIFGDLTRSVPDGPLDEADFTFDRQVLPVLPPKMTAGRVVFSKAYRDYNNWYRTDMLTLFVEPFVARELGLFLLSCAFHEPAFVTLELPSTSHIRQLVYRSPLRGRAEAPMGLREIPATFRYFPGRVSKHPWLDLHSVHALPLLALSNLDECVITDQQREARDTVFVESTSAGTVRLAELLLNAGCSSNTVREFDLEGEAGFRGVAPLSAELRIALPGSDVWIAHPDRTLADV
jgi:hypothetical protein